MVLHKADAEYASSLEDQVTRMMARNVVATDKLEGLKLKLSNFKDFMEPGVCELLISEIDSIIKQQKGQ